VEKLENWSFHVVDLQRTPKRCTGNYDARAQPLCCSLNLLFGDVLVAVAVVFCVRSLLIFGGDKRQPEIRLRSQATLTQCYIRRS